MDRSLTSNIIGSIELVGGAVGLVMTVGSAWAALQLFSMTNIPTETKIVSIVFVVAAIFIYFLSIVAGTLLLKGDVKSGISKSILVQFLMLPSIKFSAFAFAVNYGVKFEFYIGRLIGVEFSLVNFFEMSVKPIVQSFTIGFSIISIVLLVMLLKLLDEPTVELMKD